MKNITQNNAHISTLVIEDNDGDYVLVEDFLLEKFNKIEIKHCRDFKESASYIENNKTTLSIILLDLHLTDLSGVDLIKKILSCATKIPIIILTGYADLSIAKLSLQLGVYDFLIKDELKPDLLQKSIDFAINRRQFISQIESERSNFENLFNFSPQPMWLLDNENFNILNANFSAIKMYDYSIKDYQQMTFPELHPKEEYNLICQTLSNLNNDSSNVNFTHFLKNGKEIKVDIYLEKIKGYENDHNKRIIVQSINVTDTLDYINTIEIQNKKLRKIAWTQSHIVRAPLARILGIINLIEKEKENLDDHDDLIFWLNQLKVSSNEMDDIVKEIVADAQKPDLTNE